MKSIVSIIVMSLLLGYLIPFSGSINYYVLNQNRCSLGLDHDNAIPYGKWKPIRYYNDISNNIGLPDSLLVKFMKEDVTLEPHYAFVFDDTCKNPEYAVEYDNTRQYFEEYYEIPDPTVIDMDLYGDSIKVITMIYESDIGVKQGDSVVSTYTQAHYDFVYFENKMLVSVNNVCFIYEKDGKSKR